MIEQEHPPQSQDLWQTLLETCKWGDRQPQSLTDMSTQDIWLLHQDLFDLWWETNDELQRRRA